MAADGSGDISPSKLANSLGTKRNAAQVKYGKGDQSLVELAQAGKEILPERTGNSGTAARTVAQLLGPGALAAGASLAKDHDPMEAIKWGALGVVAPMLARAALQNPAISGYLSGGLGSSAARAALSAPQTNALIGAPIKKLPIFWGLGMLNAPQQ